MFIRMYTDCGQEAVVHWAQVLTEAVRRAFANVVSGDYIVAMKAIGVRELKAQLSRYLREVATGEVVLVTDRGRVVAELRAPSDRPSAPESDVNRRLRLLATRIPLTMGTRRSGYSYRESPVSAAAGTARQLLDEERDEHDRLR